jgi:hypothetical protein
MLGMAAFQEASPRYHANLIAAVRGSVRQNATLCAQ